MQIPFAMLNKQNEYTISSMYQLSWYILRSFRKSFYFYKDIQIRLFYPTILVGSFHRHIDHMAVPMRLAPWLVVEQDGCNEVIMLHVVCITSLYYEISLLNCWTFPIVPDCSKGIERKSRRSDPVLWQNPLYQQKIRKQKDNTHKRHKKRRLHNDCGPT